LKQKPPEPAVDTRHADIQELERELLATRAHLQAAIDELERTNEELISANEEYQSVNEELQSSNEELETSKEEQQSINEELQTVNAELSSTNDTLARANSDLQNLLDSTQIATVFLSTDLRVRNFTPATTDIFHLREGDRGRPLTEIVTRLVYGDLARDVKKVLRSLSTIEREVQVRDEGATFLLRIRPYRTVDNVIDGAVITFVDISDRKREEEQRSRLAAIVDSSNDAIIGHSFAGVITSWNPGAEKLFGYTAAEVVGKPLALLIPDDRVDEVPQTLERVRRGDRVEQFETERVGKDGELICVALAIAPIRGKDGEVIAASTIARDVTEVKRAETHRNLLVGELDHRVKNMLALVSSLASQTLRATHSSKDFVLSFQGRLKAMSHFQALLTQSNWRSVPLRDIVLGTLSPYQNSKNQNIVVGGDDVLLTPKATLALSMAVHELATNAAKFGSLSKRDGRVEATWVISEAAGINPRIKFEWIESGGPPVVSPSHHGFGSRLIEQTVAYEIDGTVDRQFLGEGVRCTIEFPLKPNIGSLRLDWQ
jgi:two-component system CheB/CheR fusion protein